LIVSLDSTSDQSLFRVLALDGGGIKGTFCAAALATLEEMNPGIRIADYFDLICGTSTGGIIALGLGLGLTAREILDFYIKRGPQIFPVTGILGKSRRKIWQRFIGPKYDQEPLRRAVDDVFGERKLGESSRRLVLTSYDATRGDIKLFKTAHSERLKQDFRCRAADVAQATSAAPTYFRQATTARGDLSVDGGIWANAPITVGIHEASLVLGYPLEQIHMLSIGTTDEPFSVSLAESMRGAVWRGERLIDLFMNAQVAGAVAQGRLLLRDRFFRLNRIVQPGRFALDDSTAIDELRNLGDSSARHSESEIHRRFIAPGCAPRFQPFYVLEETFG